MYHQDAAGLGNRGGNRFPVVGVERAQIQDLGLRPRFALGLRRRLERALHQRAIGNYSNVTTWAHHMGLAERHHVLGTGVSGPVVGGAVEVLVLEEQYRVVAADGSAQQPVAVQGIRGHHHAQPRRMRKNALARLAVIDGAAGEIPADGHPQHDRAAEGVDAPSGLTAR